MRPLIDQIKNGDELKSWYWLKEELIVFCKQLGISSRGSKFEIQERLAIFIDTGEIERSVTKTHISKFNWSKEKLNEETVITDNVSFGPNFRGFMKEKLGSKFSCTSEFMSWVKNNSGKTLADAINYWKLLEERKKDPNFRRKIASHNMYNQYMRDFMDAFPKKSIEDAKLAWSIKKTLPAKEGFVKFHPNDLHL